MDTLCIKKNRLLIGALIVSCSLNVALLTIFLPPLFQNREKVSSLASPPKSEKPFDATYRKVLSDMSKVSFAELVAFLTNKEIVEEGVTKRDLALASLVAFHHFNLEKALASNLEQVRRVSFSPNQEIDIYVGLDNEQFDAIIRFAYREKWPLTSKGIFQLIQKKNLETLDESLKESFFSTPEFYSLQLLFQKSLAPQPTQTLLQLISEGSWDYLEQFHKHQSQTMDLSLERRRQVLLEYVSQGSSTAAALLIETDFAFSKQRLEDSSLFNLLSLLKGKNALSERFCIEILSSARVDKILQIAADRLYAFSGETPPQPFLLKEAIARFTCASSHVVSSQPERKAPMLRQYTVQEGDSLWKIARLHKVKVDELVQLNELVKDQLYPGMILLIP